MSYLLQTNEFYTIFCSESNIVFDNKSEFRSMDCFALFDFSYTAVWVR